MERDGIPNGFVVERLEAATIAIDVAPAFSIVPAYVPAWS
jgi:hypothetical protein